MTLIPITPEHTKDRQSLVPVIQDELNSQKVLAIAQLGALADDYEQGFGEVQVPSVEKQVAFIPLVSKEEPKQQIADHFEIYGEGKTVQEAIEKWRLDLSAKPQKGKTIFWRVRPEIDWEYDFRSKIPRWRVYARASVLA